MTANQIAYQTMLVDQKVRENQLEETQRHNKEVERLQDDANRYQKEYNDAQTEWLKFQANWKTEYEAKFREYELAQEDQKIYIQDELRKLEERKTLTDEDYKRRMSTAEMMRVENEKRKTQIDADFKEFQKSKGWAELGLAEKDLILKDKSIEYERAMQHEQNLFNYEIGKQRNKIAENFNIAKIDFDYVNMMVQRENFNRNLEWQREYGGMEFKNKSDILDFQKYQYETTGKKLDEAQRFNLVTSGITGRSGITGTLFDGFETAMKFTPIGGLTYGTSQAAKAAAEALFK